MVSKKNCVIGHRNVQFEDDKIKKNKHFFEELINNYNVKIFLFGSRSNFDSVCHQVITELKAKYPFIERKCYTCKSETCIIETQRG